MDERSAHDLPAAPSAPAPDSRGSLDDGEGDIAFSPSVPPEVAHFGAAKPVEPICQWCNAPLPSADATRCPACGALLHPVDEPAEVRPPVPGAGSPVRSEGEGSPAKPASGAGRPDDGGAAAAAPAAAGGSAFDGLTADEVDLLAGSSESLRREIAQHSSNDALQPPPVEVRRAMLEIEREAFEADPVQLVDPGPLAEKRDDELAG